MLAPFRTAPARADGIGGCVYVASLSFIVCEHRGACNQRKEGFVILLDQFGNTPFPLLCQDKIRSWRSKPTCIYIQKIVRDTLKPLKTRKHVVMYT